jgi:hypothetical protein
VELVAVVVDLGGGAHVAVTAHAKYSQVLAEGIVRAKGFILSFAEVFGQSVDVPRLVGVYHAFPLVTAGDTGIGKVSARPKALVGLGRFLTKLLAAASTPTETEMETETETELGRVAVVVMEKVSCLGCG